MITKIHFLQVVFFYISTNKQWFKLMISYNYFSTVTIISILVLETRLIVLRGGNSVPNKK